MPEAASSATPSGRALIDAVLAFLAGQDRLTLQDLRHVLETEVDAAGLGALMALKTRLTADEGWSYYGPDDLARRIHHLLADRLLQLDSGVDGLAHLAELPAGPLVVAANHLSYADANLIELLLERAGASTLAGRLTALAGPKVFTSRTRRFSSLCFGTIKVPQSADIASEEAVLSPREVARAARRAIEIAHERLRAGDALLLFGEGRRSRTASMQPMLPAVARYLELPGTWILPMGLTGTEALFPIGDGTIRPARVRLNIGRPFEAAAAAAGAGGDRRRMMDAIGFTIAALLPAEYRGAYSDGVRS